MTPAEMEARIVRYGDLRPCKTAFIDAHTPGSNLKENFTIIGDTCAVPPGLSHALEPAMTGEASLYRVASTDDAAGATARLL